MTDFRDQVQSTLGDAYRIERELGGGGMSRVFVARESAHQRPVVIKVLPAEMAASVSIERFKREIALAARLQHPHIVPLLTSGDIDGLPYFTMPFVDGESLRARLTRGGELPVPEGLRILREVASALDYAHEQGVVHRDIKPDNVLLSRGSAMVSDFGVAKALSASSNAENSGMTSLGVALGTPAYMSPEQAAANPNIDARADVYAYGVMAYELFAGRAPFAGRSPQAMLAAHVIEAPEPIQKLRPALPPALASLIMQCLEKHPADRPQTAADIVHALDAIHTPSGGMSPTGVASTTGSQSAPPTDSRRRRTAVLAAGLAAVVIGVVIVATTMARRGGMTATGAANAADVEQSIAIVPFTGGDAKDEYFGDGVADELTSMLARVPLLSVAARSSAFAFKGKPLTSRQIGESLHVATVVEGTVRRAESRLRITASLINVATGRTLWSESYDRDPQDVFAVQQEIATKIADQLKVTLGSSTGGTTNIEAHDLFLQARFHAAKLVEPEQRRALELYGKAIALDSNFAAAWAGIGDAWLILADDWEPPREAYPKAMAAGRRALALDPRDPIAHAVLGATLAFFEWDYPAALEETSRAVELAPSSVRALWFHGSILQAVPHLNDSALVVYRRATQLDPHDAALAAYACRTLIDLKDLEAAAEECARARGLDAHSPDAIVQTNFLYRQQHRYEEALKIVSVTEASPGRLFVARVYTYFDMGRPDDARRAVEELLAESRRRFVRTDYLAGIYLRLGDRTRLADQIERDWKTNAGRLRRFPFDDPRVKDDARVQAIGKLVKAKQKLLPGME